jgi:hypothetical protein
MIKEGEWFCAIEGIALAERVYNIYFEEFDNIPQNKKTGDLKMSVVQYRLFCDFEGHPIKRNRFKYFNAAYCSPMSVKWEKLLRKSICNNPKEYASFVKFLQKPKEIKGHVTLNYVFDERDKDNVICGINAIRRKLPSRFTFLDLQNIAEDNQFVINMNNFIDDTFDASTYIRIFLIYKFGDSIGKRILFNKLDFEIHGKTSSC